MFDSNETLDQARARNVRDALTDILAPVGLSPDTLRDGGRYAEDSY
mgnify:CR=1 FL=1